ncbi:MAG TPA: hypothetical protein DGD08_00960 [Gemmatimonas aurantiaca]|uniref:Flagellar protein FlgJ N-terminal domain-containing protein n=2 Tax=Gemmatimonas aurantiaca TaxID=173480 RepID=C1A533_GEMAT|nr:rod-binding protein [Gemmatimonas aurantiaca]BAH37343.1 hypothetical protein GAU_0301 [Gemmatimonas aurantiaca T-27]HCT55759.1 hypothetical protein [Gemmatimonas aurantiaca]
MIDSVTSRAMGVTSTSGTPPRSADADTKLRETAKQLEGLFVQQLFKVMRQTVPQQEGFVSGGAGEDMFTGLMDEHLAAETPNQLGSGLSEALYRQLRGFLPASPADRSSDVASMNTVSPTN